MHSHISMIYATSCAYSAGEPIHIKLIFNHLKGVCVLCMCVSLGVYKSICLYALLLSLIVTNLDNSLAS